MTYAQCGNELDEMMTRYRELCPIQGKEHGHLFELIYHFDVSDENEPERVAQFHKIWKETTWTK